MDFTVKFLALTKVKVKNSSPKSLSAGSIPTVNRQLTNSKPTLKNLTSVMTSQSPDPYGLVLLESVA